MSQLRVQSITSCCALHTSALTALAVELLLRRAGGAPTSRPCEQAVRQVRMLRNKAPAELAAELASWRPNLLYVCAGAGPGGTLLALRLGPAGQPGGMPSGAGADAAAASEAAPSALKEEAAASGNGVAPVGGSTGANGGAHVGPALNGTAAGGAPGAADEGPIDMDVEGVDSAFSPELAPLRALSLWRTASVA